VKDEKKILDVLLDDDESFIVKKRSKDEKIENIVKQVRETIKKRVIDEELKEEKSAVQIKRLEKIKQSIEGLSVKVSELERAISDERKKVAESIVTETESTKAKVTEIKPKFEKPKVEERPEKPKFKEQPYLSDVEINILKAILKYGANVRRISRVTGYPEIVISKAIEKLIEKGYLDENLNVAEKAVYLAGIPSEERGIGIKIIDIAIILTAIVLVLSTLYYFGYIP